MAAPLTFLFTDLEDSTRLWEQFPDAMQTAMARHDEILRETVESQRGRVVKARGDGIHAVFESASAGIASAVAAQQAIVGEQWPVAIGSIKVRMGLHTGESRERDGDYFGSEVNRAARVSDTGHGGQILVSEVTAGLLRSALPADVTLFDLGEHRLKGLEAPEQIFQVYHPALPAEFPPLRSLSIYKHNLPVRLSSFVGRERELAEVKRLLAQTRCLTLLGPGGTGKTRLAQQAAAEVIDQFPDGVWLVELAPLTDPDLIAERIAASLNVREQAERSMLDTLTIYLRGKALLLLLDNVEHLVRDSAELADHLLRHCPSIKILVTGRESLFIGGETTLQIPSLSIPGRGNDGLDVVAGSEAAQLFLARARSVRPDFQLTEENANAVAEVVRRLDGIPLALELAAARMRMMSVEQIAARLNDRFRLLTGGRRTALPRQQTLQAMIDWSWNLLDDNERKLLRRLSIFSGGWTLEAAQMVCSDEQLDEFDVLDTLDHLVNKSLITVDHLPEGAVRYGMLESIRQYARDRLFETGEGEPLRDRHAEHFTAFGEQASIGIEGKEMLVWLDRFMPETDNMNVTREWGLESRLDLALRITAFSQLILRQWLFNTEGRRWLEQVVEQVRVHPAVETETEYQQGLAKAIVALGDATLMIGKYAEARTLLEEGIVLAEVYGVLKQQFLGTILLLIVLQNIGEEETAKKLAEKSMALSREPGLDFLRHMNAGVLVRFLASQGNLDEAEALIDGTIQAARQLGNPWLSAISHFMKARHMEGQKEWVLADASFMESARLFQSARDTSFSILALSTAGHVKRLSGDLMGAETLYRQMIVAFQERGHFSAVAHLLECFGFIASAQDNHVRSAKLLGAGQAIRDSILVYRLPEEQDEYDQTVAHLGEAMGVAARDNVMTEGRLLDLDDAVSYVLAADS